MSHPWLGRTREGAQEVLREAPRAAWHFCSFSFPLSPHHRRKYQRSGREAAGRALGGACGGFSSQVNETLKEKGGLARRAELWLSRGGPSRKAASSVCWGGTDGQTDEQVWV